MEGEWLICHGAELPFRGTSNWQNTKSVSKFYSGQVQSLASAKKNHPVSQYGLGMDWLGSSSAERPGVLLDKRLDGNQQCSLVATRANCTLGCIRKSIESRSGGKWVFFLLLDSCGAPSVILCPVLPTTPPHPAKSREIPTNWEKFRYWDGKGKHQTLLRGAQ